MVSLSSLRSSLVPTRIMGTCGQWCRTSGYHLARTFSKLAGFTREKQIRNTSCKEFKSHSQESTKLIYVLLLVSVCTHRLRIWKWPQSVVVLLTRSVPQSQVDRPAVYLFWEDFVISRYFMVRWHQWQSNHITYHDIGGIVVEHGGDVVSREVIGCVADQQTCFT